jgi:hypothetical protein
MDKFLEFCIVLIINLIFDLILAWCVMGLWNVLLPVLFSFPIITFWQAFGLMILIDILFKNRVGSSK